MPQFLTVTRDDGLKVLVNTDHIAMVRPWPSGIEPRGKRGTTAKTLIAVLHHDIRVQEAFSWFEAILEARASSAAPPKVKDWPR
jgi:hypothetical protein